MKQFLSILIFLSFLVCSTNAQEIQRPESYNYKQGVEALQNNDLEKALEFLTKNYRNIKITDMPSYGSLSSGTI